MVPSLKFRNRFVNQSLKRKAVGPLLKKGDWFGTSIQKTDFKLGPLFDTPCLLRANERSELEEKVFAPAKFTGNSFAQANNCWRRRADQQIGWVQLYHLNKCLASLPFYLNLDRGESSTDSVYCHFIYETWFKNMSLLILLAAQIKKLRSDSILRFVLILLQYLDKTFSIYW